MREREKGEGRKGKKKERKVEEGRKEKEKEEDGGGRKEEGREEEREREGRKKILIQSIAGMLQQQMNFQTTGSKSSPLMHPITHPHSCIPRRWGERCHVPPPS